MNDLATVPSPSRSGSTGGPRAMVYVRDEDSEGVIRQALGSLGVSDAEFNSGGVTKAIADLSERPSPRLLIVDVGDVADPRGPAADLVGVCEPSTGVVLVGESNDIRLYRVLRESGVAEYFFKPLVLALLAPTCGAILNGAQGPSQGRNPPKVRTGKLIFVLGARGGVGATSIAVRTAWRLAEHPPRPVMLLDLDLQLGDAALQLDVKPGHALREALERAERVDELFLERGVIHVTKHLSLLASLEPLAATPPFEEEALLSLLDALGRRYRYIVVDFPVFRAVALPHVLHLPSFLVVVSDGRLSSAREVGRLRELVGPDSPERTTMQILNKNGAPGSLQLDEFTRGAGRAPDVVIPWSQDIAAAANLGVKIKPDSPAFDRALAPLFARVAGERVQGPRSLFSRLRLS